MADKRKPPESLAGDRAAEERKRTNILAAPGGERKQDFGSCASCGIKISTTSTTLHCPTCSAWRRWFSAHRVASQALKEATR